MTEPAYIDDIMDEFADDLAPDGADDQFTPSTDEQFEWAIRKRNRALAKVSDIRARKAHQLELLGSKFDRLAKSEEDTVSFFDAMIERGILAMEPDSKGKRTVKTAAGTAYTRTTESFMWPDDEVLIGWAKSSIPEAVKVRESVDKAAAKKHIKATGDVPDGLSIEPLVSIIIKEG